MKFAHLADTHIRNLKYHKEYRAVFNELYTKLKKEKPDFIIHCGDIAHTKTQISPEFVEMCSNFLSGMADIAPTYVILGNHDGNLKNSSRQDALTPIVEALNHPDLYLLKNSGETELNEEFTINVLSVFDRNNWQNPSSRERINIALYHGSISGVKTDTGWTMEHGEDDINIFNNFDYGFLGDIHKTNQTLDKKGKIRYPGSTVQQNHGETNDKGFLIWDIQDKDTFDCKHIILRNPKPFITIRLTPKGRLPNSLKIQKSARLRLISENNLPIGVVRRAVDVAKVRFQPEAITYLNKSAGSRGSVESLTNSLVQEDLRDLAVQEEFIQEYLNDYQPEDNILKRVFDMNRKFNTIVEDEEDVRRNINWKLKKVQWDNLFNYGESNSIDFSKIEGIVGVLGKNFSGKSSIIDSLLYTVYNTTSKNNRRNFNLINQNEDWCRGYVEIDIGAKTYKIERTSKKYVKKLKGKETGEAKTDVEFNVYDNATDVETSFNGITRMETDKNIRKIFGTIEDFLITSMASQLESLSYINEGSTRRKEILAKFLDLEIFEKKFRLCKEASSDVKGTIRKMSDRNFDDEIFESNTELARTQTKLLNRQRLSEESAQALLEQRTLLSNIETQINSIPEEVIDIKQVLKNLKDIKKQAAIIEVNLNKKKERVVDEKEVLQKIENFVDGFDIENVNGQKQVADEFVQRLQQIENDISEYESTKEVIKKKIGLLKDAPCSHKLQNQCHFVSDARHAIDDSNRVKIGLNQLTLNKTTVAKKLDEMNIHKLDEYSNKYYLLQEKSISKRDEVSKLKIDIERDKMKLFKANNLLENLEEKEQLYEQNKEAIENFEQLSLQKEHVVKSISLLENDSELQKTELINLYTAVGRSEQKNTELTSQRDEFLELQEEFTTADLFMRCVHANGISYDIIKKRLPLINDEISKILTNIVEFEVFFENDDKKLDILIKHPSHDARPIEMGSGAEKTIAAMAIRLALLNVSTLPKGDIFILDEPGTALDAENMEGFIRILDMVKAQFKTVLLISHLDSLKDVVDRQIIIEKIDGRAYVNE